MAVKVKICGITQYEDARVAVSLGADALGFIFYPGSRRYIAPADAREIIRRLPPFVSRVGVFVDETPENIMAAARIAGIDTAQLHGSESPSLLQQLPLATVKAFSIAPDFDLTHLDTFSAASAFLLDTWDAQARGGTGRTFDWNIARRAVMAKHTVVLAGGLGPVNIGEAIETVQPYGVDVNSGVEIRPGIKNPQKMREVIRIAKG